MINKLKNTRFLQYYGAIAATAAISATSCYLSWPSPVLPRITSADSPIGVQITKEEGSWIYSIYSLASVPANMSASWLLRRFGRKGTLLISFLPTFFPWFAIMFADSFWSLMLIRIIAGLGMGLAIPACAVFNGEISDPDVRGKITSMFNLMKLMGDLLMLTTGPFVSYQALAGIGASMALLFLLMFFWVPESPYHYVQHGKMEDAKKALKRFNPDDMEDSQIEKKLSAIKTTIALTQENSATVWEFISNPKYRRIIFIMWGVKTLQMMSGTLAMDGYLQTIIESSGSSISPELSSIIFGVVQIPAALLTVYLVDRVGRKPLLVFSATGAALALFAEGVYFFMQDYLESDVAAINWLPTTALTIYIIMKPIGLQSLPYVLLGEVFPNNIKDIAVAWATVYGASLGFVTMKVFEPLSEAWGRYTMFWIFCGMCLAGSAFVLKFLPETKGKSFEEIHAKIYGGKYEKSKAPGNVNSDQIVKEEMKAVDSN